MLPSSVGRLRKLEIVVFLLLLLLTLCIVENVVKVRAERPNQNANHVSASDSVDLAYLATHLADFENLTVTTKGIVRRDIYSFFMFEDFLLEAQTGERIMVDRGNSFLSVPLNGSFVEISGMIQYFALEGGAYFLNATSLTTTSTALTLENIKIWYWTDDTVINSVAGADVDGDSKTEIVTGGGYYDGTRFVAQLCVWNGFSLALEQVQTWYWNGNTTINSIALGDVNGDGETEIITGGYYYDGTRDVAQLCVWNGSSLALENVKTWFWAGNTVINSVVLGDVDGDGQVEVVTGGYYNDGSRNIAQLCVWNGSSLALENVKTWYWVGNTVINSVVLGDVDGDGQVEVVTGGYFNDGARNNAQLIEWNGINLTVDRLMSWFWTNNTVINSVSLGDVDGDGQVEVVTGGYFNDNTRDNAQLIEWNGANLSVDRLTSWFWTSNTVVNSVAIGDDDGEIEMVTGGQFNDGTRDVAQLVFWNGADLTLDDIKTWYWTGDTTIFSVTIGDVVGDGEAEIITGGCYNDGFRSVAQLVVWEMKYPTPPIAPLDLWWQTNWTNNAATLNVTYNQIANPRSWQDLHITTIRHPNGVFWYRTRTTNYGLEDTYGRLTNTTTREISYSPSGSFYLDPNPPAANGSLVYPSYSSFEQSQFFRNFTSTATYDNYTTEIQKPNGTYNEDFFGVITTSAGEIAFFGNVTSPLTWLGSNQAFGIRTEKISYFLNGKPYAETTLTTTWIPKQILGVYVVMNESDVTETFFADGSQRTSEITILYQRDDHGTQTGKSGVGTVWGTDLVEEQSVDYTGSITLSYINPYGVYIKSGYYETRNTTSKLLTRVPFEVLFIDDPLMRPLF